jgi:ketosteroid isomerase-like protein
MSFKDGSAKTEDVMVSGDLAVETGTFAWTLQPKSGAEVKDKGKYLTVWKRQADGSWKIVRDIDNSDLPAKR